jgi:antitoxin VapB
MTVTIEDPKLDEQLVALSGALGKSVDEFVHDAVQEKITRMRPTEPKRKIDWDAIRAIQERVAKMPILDSRSDDEILGYNEFGTFD